MWLFSNVHCYGNTAFERDMISKWIQERNKKIHGKTRNLSLKHANIVEVDENETIIKKSQSNTLHSSHLAKAFLRKHTFFLSPDIIFTASKCFPEFLLVQLFWCLVFIRVSAKRVLHTFLARESRVHRHAITNNVR